MISRMVESWPHAPARLAIHPGAYMLTASTLGGELLFGDGERLDVLQDAVLGTLGSAGWSLQAWAFFPNHYHVVMLHDDPALSLGRTVARAHAMSAIAVNRRDEKQGRKVWLRYWDTHLTFERSYLARLAYVHDNPARHGIVRSSETYPWCSMAWFQDRGDAPFVRTVLGLGLDRLNEREVDTGGWKLAVRPAEPDESGSGRRG